MKFSALLLLWVLLFAVSLGIGQYPVSLEETGKILLGSSADETAKSVVLDIRIPRALLSSLCGGILALSGLALQAVFKNPLVGPHIVGVSTAAAFGGALCIMLGFGSYFIVGFAFFFGLAALFISILSLNSSRAATSFRSS